VGAVQPRKLSKAIGRGGARTRTGLAPHRILSPVRLPIPPLGQRGVSRAFRLCGLQRAIDFPVLPQPIDVPLVGSLFHFLQELHGL
jgi:hypothetical protein